MNNMQKTPVWRWLLPAAVLWAVGLGCAAVWDMNITQTLYSPDNVFAVLEEAFGWYPSFLPAVVLALLALSQRGLPARWRWLRAAGGVVAVGGMAGLYYAGWHHLQKRGFAGGLQDAETWIWLATGALLLAVLLLAAHRLQESARIKLWFFAGVGVVFMAGNLLIINVLKMIWNRPRFDEMLAAGSLGDFSPWYLPFAGGGSSFPSGHTAHACGILLLLVLCDLFPKKHRRAVSLVVVWAYVAAMALSRLMMGRHFLSDTLAAAALMGLWFAVIRRSALYQKGLAAVKKRVAAYAEDDTAETPRAEVAVD